MNVGPSRTASPRIIAALATITFTTLLIPEGIALEPSAAPAQPSPEKLPRIPPKSPAEEAQTFRVLDGFRMDLLAAEADESAANSVLRRDIANITGSGLSLMLDGVESQVGAEQMADLIAFLPSPQ